MPNGKKPKKYILEDQVILDNIYPMVDATIGRKSTALKSCIERFIHARQKVLYDYAPVDRIYFRKSDINDFFNSISVNEKEVTSILPNLYYWKADELSACKDEFSLTCMMVLRWLVKNKPNDKNLIELTAMYFAFSGKIYATSHFNLWRQYTPDRRVMDYVVNYMLTNKFDLVKTKSVWGAMRNLTMTWLAKYQDELAGDVTDERVVYIIHQIHNRVLAFLKNIANAYYQAFEDKRYINAESDSYDQDNYRIANNNSTVISSITEKTMIYFANSQINISICYSVSGSGVDPYDVKSIFETILSDNKRLDDLRFVINVLLTDFCSRYPDVKDITGPKFIAHSISMKPNTKDKNILELKNIILNWLNTSDRYKNIKTQATKNNYYKAILSYIAMTVNIANKNK